MAYEKLNLQDGQVLDAAALAHMEDGIVGVLPQNPGAYQYPATDGDGNMVWADRLAYEQSGQIIAEVQTCVTEDIGEYGQAWGSVQAVNAPVLEEGTVYTVSLDGTYYPCEVVLNRDDNAFVGNYSIIDSYETDNGLPFVLDVWNNGLVQVVTRTPGSYEFGLTLGETTVKTIDPKFLPASTNPLIVTLEMDDNDNWVASSTFAEISEAILANRTVVCVRGDEMFHLMKSPALSNVAPMAIQVIEHLFVSFPRFPYIDILTINDNNVIAQREHTLTYT